MRLLNSQNNPIGLKITIFRYCDTQLPPLHLQYKIRSKKMQINENTKISVIIKANKSSIDIIASINKNFKKLKNPILRTMLAPRVNVKDAARIGGIKPGVLLKKLESIGFAVQAESENKDLQATQDINIKRLNSMKNKNIVTLDVRPILDGGVDPFNAIMDELKKMNEAEETLKIINTFEPIPLLNILKKKGYEYETERPTEGEVHTYLTKTGEVSEEKVSSTDLKEDTFESMSEKFAGKMVQVDVRDLEMPMPMVTILENLERLAPDQALFVNHKKLPQYLLPELKDRNFVYVSQEIDNDNINLIIYKS